MSLDVKQMHTHIKKFLSFHFPPPLCSLSMGNHSHIFNLNPFICMFPYKTCRFVLCAHKQRICTYFKFELLALCCKHYFVCPQTILKICLCYWVYILTSNCSIVFWREHLLHFIFLMC